MLDIGTKAPDFTLHSTPDQTLSLNELKGKNVVLVFYPADWSLVCSDELSLFNQSKKLFDQSNTIAIGISVDSKWSHMAFTESRSLHMPLLADFEPKGEVSKLYNVYNEKNGYSERAIYLIDKEGLISWSYLSPEGINPGVDGVLDAIDRLNK
ncbi:peroxiredoxin [Acinetobacter lactucae]|uniref:Thioredoxin peroxidase n=2 Tax=Acinetobacter lactucae TaxID=1785128 RepID=A0A429K4S7_9GAMM|nr:peroxiredoxin [Acinetobacter lactucae]